MISKKDENGYVISKTLLVLILFILYIIVFFLFVVIIEKKRYFIYQDRLSSVNTTLFQKRILEVDGILQLLIDQVEVSN